MMVLSNFADVGRDNAFDLTDAWVAILESAAKSESVCKELQQRKLALPALRKNYTSKNHELFKQIVPVVTDFAKSLKWQAERRRRTTTATTGNGIDGFRLVDLLFIYMKISPDCTSTDSAANLCIGCLSLTDLALARHLNTTVLSTRVCQRSPTLRAKCVMGRTSRGRSRSCCRSGSFTTGRC